MSGFDLIVRPDDEDADAAEVYVDGRIGTRPYRFLLDTGAGRTCVAFDAYTATFDTLGGHRSAGVFAQPQRAALITVPSIALGPIVKRNVTVTRLATSAGRGNRIGMDMLRDACCHFLFDDSRVVVEPSDGAEDRRGWHDLAYDATFHPYLAVQVGTRPARAVWDTGAGITVVDTRVIDEQRACFEEIGRSRGTDATGASRETPLFTMAATVIGGRAFPPHTVAGVDLSPVNATITMPMDMILGYSTLSQANWWFDFPRGKWVVSRVVGGG
jgi:predicted aspartyl protease